MGAYHDQRFVDRVGSPHSGGTANSIRAFCTVSFLTQMSRYNDQNILKIKFMRCCNLNIFFAFRPEHEYQRVLH